MSGKLIENAIKEKLTGEEQKNALDFIAFMQENGFLFKRWGDDGEEGGWDPVYKGKGNGCVLVTDVFMFFLGLDWCIDECIAADDELKEFAWSRVPICPQESCEPPYCQGDEHGHNKCKNRWQIFGKVYESTCHSPLQFINPDAKTFDMLKKLLLMTK